MGESIREGARGAPVEDVQRRLRSLGYELGPTGVDGVFLGETLRALREFQAARGLPTSGSVGPDTWSALVDATFRMGDRLLYLRVPHFHGADILALQGALNVLGFSCGNLDGIFGSFTERATREFQANVGLPADGIVGPETVKAIERLSHVWQGKDPTAPASLVASATRAADALAGVPVAAFGCDADGLAVAERLSNLAEAAGVAVSVGDDIALDSALLLRIAGTEPAMPGGVPVVVLADSDASDEARFVSAVEGRPDCREIHVVLPKMASGDEHAAQSLAVRILDGVCAVLSRRPGGVVP